MKIVFIVMVFGAPYRVYEYRGNAINCQNLLKLDGISSYILTSTFVKS